ncbi:heavy metal-associated isoprenylated plant protein 8-like protein [Tanacetum coccineum]|uniref:Heavy metal-associated isoprenylated plant protein 8-like protein n=1 Tax=Tanacetum coccineum TaxID=301880 RepID=A0ABQ5AY58_9ASTR
MVNESPASILPYVCDYATPTNQKEEISLDGINKNRNNNNNNNNNNNANTYANENAAKTEEQQNNQEEKKDEAGTAVGDNNAKGSQPTTDETSKGQQEMKNKQNCWSNSIGGVEVVEPNTKDNQVTVKGKNCDPVRIQERVRHKSGKHVEIISPVQKKQQEKKPQEKKPEAPKVTETVLKMHLHCEGCAKEVKRCVLKMAGVQSSKPDMESSTGQNQNQNQNQNDGDHKDNEKKNKDKDGKNIGLSYPNVPPEFVYAPQIFSDENPNACTIM